MNTCILDGNLTRDVEVRVFGNNGKVAKIGLAVNNKKKNAQTGQWEDNPMFIDCEVYNRGENGRSADTAEQYLKKGSRVLFRGRLELDQWEDKTTGQQRQKHKLVVDEMTFLGGNNNDTGGDQAPAEAPAGRKRAGGRKKANDAPSQAPGADEVGVAAGDEQGIPF